MQAAGARAGHGEPVGLTETATGSGSCHAAPGGGQALTEAAAQQKQQLEEHARAMDAKEEQIRQVEERLKAKSAEADRVKTKLAHTEVATLPRSRASPRTLVRAGADLMAIVDPRRYRAARQATLVDAETKLAMTQEQLAATTHRMQSAEAALEHHFSVQKDALAAVAGRLERASVDKAKVSATPCIHPRRQPQRSHCGHRPT